MKKAFAIANLPWFRTMAIGLTAALPLSAGIGAPSHPVGSSFNLGAKTAQKASKPWALRYYTIAGASIDFMLRYPDTFAKSVGGRPVVLKNATYRRLADLAKRFSEPFDGENASFLGKSASESGADFIPGKPFIGKPFLSAAAYGFAQFETPPAASDADLKQILRADPEWRLSVSQYSKDNKVIFWRSADAASLKSLGAAEPLVKLMCYVAGPQLPFGFVLQAHAVQLAGCGDMSFEDNAFPRFIRVKVAVIENNSDHALRVGGYEGAESGKNRLRLASADDRSLSKGRRNLPWGPAVTLQAGERLIVPLRLAFSYDDYVSGSANGSELLGMLGEQSPKKDIQQFLTDFGPGKKQLQVQVFMGPDKWKQVAFDYSKLSTLVKRPWRNPYVNEDFVYGPSYRLTAFKVGRAGGPVARGKSQTISYSTAEGFGSCPFLEIWDPSLSLWLRNGRVLVNAVGAAGAREDVCELRNTPSLIRLVEKEPEETHIANIFLEVAGPDGTSTRLTPLKGNANERIRQGQELELRFDVPKDLADWPSKLHVSGYYLRKPRIMVVDPKR